MIKWCSVLILALAALHIQKIYPWLPIGNRLPWKMDTALCAVVFVIAGYYANAYDLFDRMKKYSIVLIPVFLGISYYCAIYPDQYVNICDCFYTPWYYYYTSAFCGIFALILTAMLCQKPWPFRLDLFWSLWQYCGRYSLPMLACQSFILYLLAELGQHLTGMVYMPMEQMPNQLITLGISVATFLLMALVVYPWHLHLQKKEEHL